MTVSPITTPPTPPHLNIDVIHQIVSHLSLSPTSLAHLALINSTWTHPAQTQLYRQISLPLHQSLTNAWESLARLRRTLQRNTELAKRVRGVRFSTKGGVNSVGVFQQLLEICGHVEEVVLEGCTNITLRSFLNALIHTSPHITSLTLTPHDLTDPTPSHCTSSLSTSYLSTRLHNFTSLHYLSLTRFTASVDNLWIPLSSPNLTSLTLSNCRLNPHDLAALFLPSITTLHLHLQYNSSHYPIRSSTREELITLLHLLHTTLRHLSLIDHDLTWPTTTTTTQQTLKQKQEKKWFGPLSRFWSLETFMYEGIGLPFNVGEGEGDEEEEDWEVPPGLRRVEVVAPREVEGLETLRRLKRGGVEVWFADEVTKALERVEVD